MRYAHATPDQAARLNLSDQAWASTTGVSIEGSLRVAFDRRQWVFPARQPHYSLVIDLAAFML
jgi:hypothetical protein